ncbi:MAG: HD domain-containing protein [Halanaerobiales bacterium]
MLKYEKAILFAANAHEGQKRKGDGSPYITHPLTVAFTLLDQGCKEDIVQAAILHDTVEDTRTTLDDIENEFGKSVRELVKGVSEPDKSLPWKERKEHTIKHITNAGIAERLIICADKLHNINSMIDQYHIKGESLWSIFNGDKAEQIWYYSEVIKRLKSHNDIPDDLDIFDMLEKKIEEFIDLVT